MVIVRTRTSFLVGAIARMKSDSTMCSALLAVLALFLAGCADTDGDIPESGNAAARSPDRPRPIQELDSNPGAGPASFVLNDGAGVLNPVFDNWADDQPLFWTPRPGFESRVTRSDDAKVGKFALKMTGGYTWNMVRSLVEASGPLGGRTIRLSAAVKGDEADAGYLSIALAPDDAYVAHSEKSLGNGEWHTLDCEYTFPADATCTQFWVGIGHGGSPKRPLLVDDVQVSVKPAQ
jgi:hypothetical protein